MVLQVIIIYPWNLYYFNLKIEISSSLISFFHCLMSFSNKSGLLASYSEVLIVDFTSRAVQPGRYRTCQGWNVTQLFAVASIKGRVALPISCTSWQYTLIWPTNHDRPWLDLISKKILQLLMSSSAMFLPPEASSSTTVRRNKYKKEHQQQGMAGEAALDHSTGGEPGTSLPSWTSKWTNTRLLFQAPSFGVACSTVKNNKCNSCELQCPLWGWIRMLTGNPHKRTLCTRL